MKNLIDSVFKSMERDERLFNEETDQRRKNFYSKTKQPIEVKLGANGVSPFETIKRAIWQLTTDGAMHSTVVIDSLAVTSLKPLMVEFSGRLSLAWSREHEDGYGMIKLDTTIETKRPTKFSTIMNDVLKKRIEFCNFITEDQCGLRCSGNKIEEYEWREEQKKTLTSLCNRLVKDTINTTSVTDESVWVYFTTTNLAKHYNKLSSKEGIDSCMSKTASYFGNTYDGKYRHPLQGYEYSPDFRLALVSNKSPDEIKNCKDEYPFLCRSIVFPTPYEHNYKVAYSRTYGNERFAGAIRSFAERIEKPEGYTVYGVMCNGLNDMAEADKLSNTLKKRYEDGEAIEHMIAPYIDTWNNSLVLVGNGTPFVREDGIKVVELRTSCTDNDGDYEDEDTEIHKFDNDYVKLSIFYGTAIVQWYRGERDYTLECFYTGDEWDYGDRD